MYVCMCIMNILHTVLYVRTEINIAILDYTVYVYDLGRNLIRQIDCMHAQIMAFGGWESHNIMP